MCGRFVRRYDPTIYASMFEVEPVPAAPSYNVAPTQDVAVVRMHDGQRESALMRWGLIPFWSKDGKLSLINARAETLTAKPAFRRCLANRRCLILADGFYEWKKSGKAKQPYFFHRRDDQPFAFAGLWDRWRGAGDPMDACTIITTDANGVTRPVHDRMPVMLSPAGAALWLDPDVDDLPILEAVLKPYPDAEMDAYPVSALVNSPRNNAPELLDPLAEGAQ